MFASSAALAPLTMFAYLGLESATVPAGDVRDPRADHSALDDPRHQRRRAAVRARHGRRDGRRTARTAGRARSRRSRTRRRSCGGRGRRMSVSLGVIVSSIGALNGWTLLMAQVPMAAAQDGLFPPLFGRLSPRGVPAFGIVISAGLATALLLVQVSGSPGFAADLQPDRQPEHDGGGHPVCVLRARRRSRSPRACGKRAGASSRRRRNHRVRVFGHSRCTDAARRAVLYGLMLLILGIPVYVWQQRRRTDAA